MAPSIYVNRALSADERRSSVQHGDFHLVVGNPTVRPMVEWATTLIGEAFGELDPQLAQHEIEVPEFIKRVSPLKSKFTNDAHTKELMADLLIGLGYDPDDTYYDLPRLRAVPSDGYLTTGVSYAYRPHRDTWYSHPPAVVNHWVPVFDTVGANVMSFWVEYWDRRVGNSGFDYDSWVAESRFAAASQVGVEQRPHPLPTDPIDGASEIRFAPNAGDVIIFSTCQLHGTAPNVSGRTRFSFDMRTLSLRDLQTGAGPADLDGRATGTTVKDFLRVADHAPLSDVYQRAVVSRRTPIATW